MRKLEFEELSDGAKKVLLSAFDYEVDGQGQIIDRLLNQMVMSAITKKPLTIKDAALLPGSLRVVDADPLIIAKYLREEIEIDGA